MGTPPVRQSLAVTLKRSQPSYIGCWERRRVGPIVSTAPTPAARRHIGDVAERLLTAEDVAKMLQVSVKTVLRLPIRRVTLGKRMVRYEPADVQQYIEGRKLVAL